MEEMEEKNRKWLKTKASYCIVVHLMRECVREDSFWCLEPAFVCQLVFLRKIVWKLSPRWGHKRTAELWLSCQFGARKPHNLTATKNGCVHKCLCTAQCSESFLTKPFLFQVSAFMLSKSTQGTPPHTPPPPVQLVPRNTRQILLHQCYKNAVAASHCPTSW